MLINFKLIISRLVYELLNMSNTSSIKADYAKDKLGATYKCICIDQTYFVVPSCDRDHTFDSYHRLTWQTPNQKNIHHRTGLRLDKIPHGPSELIAWSDAYDKLLAYKITVSTTTIKKEYKI